MKECIRCGFNDADYGCTCLDFNKWYACPIENKKPENIKALKEYADQMNKILKTEREDKICINFI